MKILVMCSAVMLTCACCRDTSGPGASKKRCEQVGKMIKAHYVSKYEFEVRGPLTLAEFEKERRLDYQAASAAEQKNYGPTKDSVDSRVARECGRIRLLSKAGDELYFFTSEKRSWGDLAGKDGYVLIRKREIVDLMIRSIN